MECSCTQINAELISDRPQPPPLFNMLLRDVEARIAVVEAMPLYGSHESNSRMA